ncbi:hypothetical protein J25TS5_03980 [Paenibacillus faecis]|uniref:phage tail assembly chaperone G n=1 Tax=Paenibacillus faecis TaxID=862114 RepID=UPI001B26971A|nr:hypothetical protein [Paenibacillus faecis]GIO83466.1 hypothetical protein J25TS5_03980 [Paenibacillus faecis]
MKIKLVIEGQEKEFVQSFVPGRVFRKTLEMQKQLSEGVQAETVDSLIDFIVSAFGNQFTFDQCYDGIDARKVLTTVVAICEEIINGGSEAIGAEPDPNA